MSKVAFFVGCAANYSDHEVAKATMTVLRRNGFVVAVPNQKCCGLPLAARGDLSGARGLAQCNVDSLLQADCDIVTSCTSCALALKVEYPRLLDTEQSRTVAQRSYDTVEYLANLRAGNRLNLDFGLLSLRGLYHGPCHLKVLGDDLIGQRISLMNLIPGIEVARVDRGCCGMAGTFGVKRRHYQTSMRIGKALFEAVKERGSDEVITECFACSLQIAQGTGLTVSHPVQLLSRAYQSRDNASG